MVQEPEPASGHRGVCRDHRHRVAVRRVVIAQEGLDLDIEVPAPPVSAPKAGVSWHNYHVKDPVHCDVCLAEIHARWPYGTHAPNRAVYRRKENGEDTYWCAVHAEPKRDKDGVSRAKPKKKGREV